MIPSASVVEVVVVVKAEAVVTAAECSVVVVMGVMGSNRRQVPIKRRKQIDKSVKEGDKVVVKSDINDAIVKEGARR